MGDGVWSSEFVDVVFGCVFAGFLGLKLWMQLWVRYLY